MKYFTVLQKGVKTTIEPVKYGPDKKVNFEQSLFIAEYNSLRSEILQRISQQTTLYQIAITAFGVIVGYALEKIEVNGWYNDVTLVCVYPLLAFLLSYAWAFNQIRICQIAQYLRKREQQITEVFGLIWWENYIIQEPAIKSTGKETFPKHVKNRPGFMVLAGTQIASIVLAAILLGIHVFDKTHTATHKSQIGDIQTYLLALFLFVDIIVTFITCVMIRRSGGN